MTYRALKYSDLNTSQLKEIYTKLRPDNSNLFPSIVLSWSNENDESLIVVGKDWVLGYLSPTGLDNFWAFNSKSPLDSLTIETVVSTARSIDPLITTINHITPISLEASNANYKVQLENEGSYNYIYDVNEIVTCSGSKFADMRRQIKLFQRYSPTILTPSFAELSAYLPAITKLHSNWHIRAKTDGSKQVDYEPVALQRLLNLFQKQILADSSLLIVLITIKDKLVGVTINELLPENYVLNHYFKTSDEFNGSGHYLFYTTLQTLQGLGAQIFNYQEDLGLPGLSAFKMKMRPKSKASQLKINL